MNPNAKDNLIPYKPGQSGNPSGRPKKLLSSVNEDLKAQGYEKVSASNISEAYELLFNLTEEDIKKIITDKESPMILRIVARQMLDKKGGVEMLERMQDRAHGRAKQVVDGQIKFIEQPLLPDAMVNNKPEEEKK